MDHDQGKKSEQQAKEAMTPAANKQEKKMRNVANKTNTTEHSPSRKESSITTREDEYVSILRAAVLVVWIVAATVVSYGVASYTRQVDYNEFELQYSYNAEKLLDSFATAIDKKLGAISTLATALTTYAKDNNQSFPFVTYPDFEVAGSNARVLADALSIHWLPLVTDDRRAEWEEYAFLNRFHIDESFLQDSQLRTQQDEELGYTGQNDVRYLLRAVNVTNASIPDEFMLQDGTRYHPRIFSLDAMEILSEGTGPYLPHWQRSPVNGAKQFTLNIDFATSRGLIGIFPYLLKNPHGVLLNHAFVPTPGDHELLNQNVLISQYRHNTEPYADDPETRVAYPVFDSFHKTTARLVGVLLSTLYWRTYFTDILSNNAVGMVCVIENSFNQTFSYRIDGPQVTFLGEGNPYKDDEDFLIHELGVIASDVDRFTTRSRAETLSYTTESLDTNYSQYRLTVYPTQDTLREFQSNQPIVLTCLVVGIFLLSAAVYLVYDYFVQKRQRLMANRAIENANMAARIQRELNEFICHEVRNPLTAAMSACNFVQSALNDQNEYVNPAKDPDQQNVIREDLAIIDSSLEFIDELLRNMLDLHRATDRQLRLNVQTTELKKSVLEPVATMLANRAIGTGYNLIVECEPVGLTINTDCLRLKQILLNLGRNAAKFVQTGFVRIRAEVWTEIRDGNNTPATVRILVEDSGPGISAKNQQKLFASFNDSLASASQGTGIGLCLCNHLVEAMGGSLWLDTSYDSGCPGSPGTRFVIDLGTGQIDPKSQMENNVSSTDSTSFATQDEEVPTSCCMKSNTSHESSKLPVLPEKLTVLFVDDDAILRKLFGRAIQQVAPGWVVQGAESGHKALELVDSTTTPFFDIIFMDQYMPSSDPEETELLGTRTIELLRERGIEARICGLSANSLREDFLAAGADCFSSKPIPSRKEDLILFLKHVVFSKE